jgi:translocator assembly and maintenance protein 41
MEPCSRVFDVCRLVSIFMLRANIRLFVTRSQKQGKPSLFKVYLSTESESRAASTATDLPPPGVRTKPRSNQHGPGLTPRRFGEGSRGEQSDRISNLPSNFGQNQLLSVSNSTRTLLEGVVASFRAPIRYAFAYGSGVFEQDGYKKDDPNPPMLDFIFAVNHPAHWHSININQHPSHYSFHTRLLGSSFISKVQDVSPGIWYNAFVRINDVNIKYGVTTLDNLCTDLLNWRSLYLAGRMHKPIRIIKDDARVRLTQQVNLASALRVALLTLPEKFEEQELYERMTAISYSGDPRMWLPTENRGKVGNIVKAQSPQFRDLYRRLAIGLPSVSWHVNSSSITVSPSRTSQCSNLILQ